jgi:hypothetical protein
MGNFVYGKLYWRSHVYGEFMLSIGGSWPSRLQARFKELGVGGSSIVYYKKIICVAPTYAQHLINEISFGETTKARVR